MSSTRKMQRQIAKAAAQAHANELNAHARWKVIRQALTALGYYGNIQFIAVELDASRALVIMNDDVLGIYDFSKQTFVGLKGD